MLTSKCSSSAVTQQNHITPLVAYGIRIYFKVLLISFKTKLDVGSGPKLLLKTNLRIPYESGKSTRFTCRALSVVPKTSLRPKESRLYTQHSLALKQKSLGQIVQRASTNTTNGTASNSVSIYSKHYIHFY